MEKIKKSFIAKNELWKKQKKFYGKKIKFFEKKKVLN